MNSPTLNTPSSSPSSPPLPHAYTNSNSNPSLSETLQLAALLSLAAQPQQGETLADPFVNNFCSPSIDPALVGASGKSSPNSGPAQALAEQGILRGAANTPGDLNNLEPPANGAKDVAHPFTNDHFKAICRVLEQSENKTIFPSTAGKKQVKHGDGPFLPLVRCSGVQGCGDILYSKNFKDHLKARKHSENKSNFACLLCPKTYTSHRNLTRHQKTHHVPTENTGDTALNGSN